MKKIKPEQDELRAEYRREDFGEMVRGKYAQRCREASNVVVISPDVQKAFRTLKPSMTPCAACWSSHSQPA